MRGFRTAPHGLVSYLEDWERELLASLLGQVGAVLDSGEQSAPGRSEAPDTGVREGESAKESALLASLDFAPEDVKEVPGEAGADGDHEGGAGAPSSSAPSLAPLLEVLLPDASEDPEVAVEVSRVTRSRLRSLKRDRLEVVTSELLQPTGEAGGVLVRSGQEPQWLGAVNDVRLVLAECLGLRQDQDVADLHAMAYEDPQEREPQEEQRRRGLALAYDMLTWWQESLVSVLLEGEVR